MLCRKGSANNGLKRCKCRICNLLCRQTTRNDGKYEFYRVSFLRIRNCRSGKGGRNGKTLRFFVLCMKLTNDSYVILIGTKNFTERYYRDQTGWLKISARGRKFRMTAEQVLNHLLPALAGIKPNLLIKVEHRGAA